MIFLELIHFKTERELHSNLNRRLVQLFFSNICKPSDNFVIFPNLVILNKQDNSSSSPKGQNPFSTQRIMGNRRNRRSRRLETPSPDREVEVTQVGTPITCNEFLTNVNTVVQGGLGENNLENQFTEPSQISNDIQVWTQIMEQKKNDRIENMREEIEHKLEIILKEIKSNKCASTMTNPGSEITENRGSQPSGSKTNKSIGVHASNDENSYSENDDYPLRASKMKDLRHPARPILHNESDVDVTINPDEESDAEEVEDYHMVTGANRQLHRQSSQKLNDTVGSHADHNLSNSTVKPLDPVNQIALATDKLANKNPSQSLFHPKNTLTFNGKNEKNEKFEYFEDLFHTTLRMQPNLTEDMEINHFHAHLRDLALKTFKNIQRTPNTTLEDILKVFRRKYVKPESSAKHRFNRLSFDPENQKLPDFLEELQESAEKAFGENAHQMMENLL